MNSPVMHMISDRPRLSDLTDAVTTHERSLDFIRYAGCLVDTDNKRSQALTVFSARFGIKDPPETRADANRKLELMQLAAVTPGTTTDATWAGPLAPVNPLAEAFLSYVRPLTILGRLPKLRAVPFNISIPVQTATAGAGFVGQGNPMSVGSLGFVTVTLGIARIGKIVVITDELARHSSPDVSMVVRQDLAEAVAAGMDTEFITPSRAPGGVNNSPGSVTNGVTPIAPSGTTAAALMKDVEVLMAQIEGNYADSTDVVLIMRSQEARMLARVSLCQTLTEEGGNYFGTSVICSAAAGTTITAVKQSRILYADGGLDLSISKNATVQMDSAPMTPPDQTVVYVPLWANNQVGFRTIRYANWKKAEATAASLVSPIAYAVGT